MKQATDAEVEELVRGFEALPTTKRKAVLDMVRLMAETPKAPALPGANRGPIFDICADCGEHAKCYLRKGVARCSNCRRKLPFKDTQQDPPEGG